MDKESVSTPQDPIIELIFFNKEDPSPEKAQIQDDALDKSMEKHSCVTEETAFSSHENSSSEREVTMREAVTTSQFWLILVMSIFSVFQGYYILNVYKAYGYTKPALNNDLYLTKVGCASALMGALRFAWSGSMDFITINPYKKVYGTLLLIQAALGFSIELFAENQLTFAIWMCLLIFCEGAHFTIIPTTLKLIYGKSASSIYGVIFSFAGLANLMIMLVTGSELGKNYTCVVQISAAMSMFAFLLLTFAFKEK